MNKEDKELQKHLIDEMMKVYNTNPDVMIYMEALMKKYEEKEQEIDRLNNVINELEKWLKEDLKQVYRDAGYRNNIINEVLDKLEELKEKK